METIEAPVKSLLTNGNEKLGPAIGIWSIPAIDTCPGKSSLCAAKCYAQRFISLHKIDYEPKLKLAESPDFVRRMSYECSLRAIVRVHVAGDFYSREYIEKWINIVSACPKTMFYAYTRSWRVPELLPLLLKLAALPNFKMLYSCDAETGIPLLDNTVYMSMNDDDEPVVPVKIVFRVQRKTVRAKMNGTVCPVEMGIKNNVTCGRCRLCFK